MNIKEKYLSIEMPDNSVWVVPVEVIARNRAEYYAHEFGGDVEKSLAEDTIPLFLSDFFEIEDWAANNMDWEDVKGSAFLLVPTKDTDFQEGWVNGEKKILDIEEIERKRIVP